MLYSRYFDILYFLLHSLPCIFLFLLKFHFWCMDNLEVCSLFCKCLEAFLSSFSYWFQVWFCCQKTHFVCNQFSTFVKINKYLCFMYCFMAQDMSTLVCFCGHLKRICILLLLGDVFCKDHILLVDVIDKNSSLIWGPLFPSLREGC